MYLIVPLPQNANACRDIKAGRPVVMVIIIIVQQADATKRNNH